MKKPKIKPSKDSRFNSIAESSFSILFNIIFIVLLNVFYDDISFFNKDFYLIVQLSNVIVVYSIFVSALRLFLSSKAFKSFSNIFVTSLSLYSVSKAYQIFPFSEDKLKDISTAAPDVVKIILILCIIGCIVAIVVDSIKFVTYFFNKEILKLLNIFNLVGAFLVIFNFFGAAALLVYYSANYKFEESNTVESKSFLNDELTAFDQDSFSDYVKYIKNQNKEKNGSIFDLFDLSPESDSVNSDIQSSPSAGKNENITNNQEQGVDEGGIVKNYKDFLVTLRRGKLFTANINPSLKAIDIIDVPREGLDGNSWYDELLMKDNIIIVIGYRYNIQATEINLFKINEDGMLQRGETYFIDSMDYYSSSNYASRLINGNLIFYMPFYFYNFYSTNISEYNNYSLPNVKKWNSRSQEIDELQPLLKETDIYKPQYIENYPMLHTVVKCNLTDFSCDAKAVLGNFSRNFYVSTSNIYIWTETKNYRRNPDSTAFVYKFDTNNLKTSSVISKGSPINQFSFKETNDSLFVVTASESNGDAMWNPTYNGGDLNLVKINLSDFKSKPKEVSSDNYEKLEKLDYYSIQNRFVNDYLLYGSSYSAGDNTLYYIDITNYKNSGGIRLSHAIQRIESLSNAAVVIGSDSTDLKFSSVELGNKPQISDEYTIADTYEGESRSHGFFYNGDEDGGIIGFAVKTTGDYGRGIFSESNRVEFINVSEGKDFSDLGNLAAEDRNFNDSCTTSCVDWYGNTRPIFLQDRIFALIGYELVEGELNSNSVREIDRITLLN